MKINNAKVAVVAAFSAAVAFAAFGREASFETAPYMDASLSIDARLDDLVSRMTLEEKVAVLLAQYPGTEGGTAIAETVFGLNNPGGKLPVSFPRSEGAIPCYYHALRDRGNYVDCEGSAAYPFGYGLSYTTFEVSKPRIEGNIVSADVVNENEPDLWAIEKTMEAKVKRRLYGDSTLH